MGDCHPGFTDQEAEAQGTGWGLSLHGVVDSREVEPAWLAVPPR